MITSITIKRKENLKWHPTMYTPTVVVQQHCLIHLPITITSEDVMKQISDKLFPLIPTGNLLGQ